jgi:O-antigen ligase
MTFAIAVAFLVARFTERSVAVRVAELAGFGIILAAGMIANARRVVLVEIAVALAIIYLLSSRRPWKRFVTGAALLSLPLILIYGAIGWNSTHRVFSPVRSVRSLFDGSTDRSTWNRDVENWNIVMSIREAPVVGRGYGKEYSEYMKGDDITRAFPMYMALPHNYVLALLLFGGWIGFTTVLLPYVVAVFLAVRTYRTSLVPEHRGFALTCVAGVSVIWLQTFGDMGFLSVTSQVLTAALFATTSKLSVESGAWGPPEGASERAAGA